VAPDTIASELVDIVDAALVLMADHDLPESTRVVRMAAGAGVHPAGVVALGLDIRGGPVKSAACIALHQLLDDAATNRVGTYLPRAGEPVPGFGHTAYPDGDPRAAYLLHRIREFDPVFMQPIDDALCTNLSSLPPPNIGFALTALVELLGAGPEASELIFVMARSAGWLAHTREEYAREPVRGTYHTVYQGP
jgi:citrate synthase